MADILTAFIEWGTALVNSWGYLGIFLISIIGNASIIFPIPSYIIVIAMGTTLNPWLLGLFGGLGAAIGELTGYAVGRGGSMVIKRKYRHLLKKTRKWSEKHGLFPILILFAATPLPDDIVGIISGVIKYNIKKFLMANIIGKIIAYTALAWGGFFGGQLLGEWTMLFVLIISFILFIIVWKNLTTEAKEHRTRPKTEKKCKW